MKNARKLLWKAVVAGLLVYAGILYFKENPLPQQAVIEQKNDTPIETVAPAVGGDFILTDQDGKAFDSKALRGKYALVFFGFTNCPDICPITLQKLDEAYKTLDDTKKAAITPVFITVDAARDTPAVLKEYAKAFDMPLISLTGEKQALSDVLKMFKVYASVQKPVVETPAAQDEGDVKATESAADPHAGHGYQVDHSSFVYVLDKEGKSLTFFNDKVTAEEIAAKLRELP
jgi:protein SCO1/2